MKVLVSRDGYTLTDTSPTARDNPGLQGVRWEQVGKREDGKALFGWVADLDAPDSLLKVSNEMGAEASLCEWGYELPVLYIRNDNG